MPLPEATLHGAAEIAVPTLVSTLAISCVFTSVVFLDGPAKYLFTPLGLAVVFAMLASYGLSRTLTPITIGLLLKGERHQHRRGARRAGSRAISHAFERGFDRLRNGYSALLVDAASPAGHRAGRRRADPRPRRAPMFTFVGRDFFPLIDGGQIQLHVRAPAGHPDRKHRGDIPGGRRQDPRSHSGEGPRLIVDNIGLPARAYNLAFTDGSTIGVNDGVILVALKDGHKPTADYVKKLRQVLPAAFPEDTFYFQAADIVTQILNFGLPAQIDVRTVGYGKANNLRVAKAAAERIAAIPGIVDAHLQQEVDAPAFYADDRPHPGRAAWPQRQHGGDQYQCQPQLVGAGVAEFLDRSDLGHSVLSRRADARIQGQLAERTGQIPRSRPRWPRAARRCPACSAMSRHSSGRRSPPTPTRPTSSRSLTCMPACRAAISAASQPTSTRSPPNCRSN